MITYEQGLYVTALRVNAPPRMCENKIVKTQRFLIKFPVSFCVNVGLGTSESVSQGPGVMWL